MKPADEVAKTLTVPRLARLLGLTAAAVFIISLPASLDVLATLLRSLLQ